MAKGSGNPSGSIAAAVHLSLQGKGGVGKSLIGSILAQYLRHKGQEVQCVDTDPVNQTFSQYSALQVCHLNVLSEGRIDPRLFDLLMERLLTEDGVFVVDSGASTFIPLWHYILENNVVNVLREAGRRLYVHSVITGGQALVDTLSGFGELAKTTPDRNVVVWVNEYFGPVQDNGKRFIEMRVFRDNEEKVVGTVAVPKRSVDTFGRDVEEMLRRKLTFGEAIESPEFSIMARQRLKVVRADLFEQLERLRLT
jgi:CobQ/CobB/MinD/ParA nucleotide binding domain